MRSQLALPLALAPHARFTTFYEGGNAALIAHLRALDARGAGEAVWLWGTTGAGRSHLLQAACADRIQRSAIYLPLAEHENLAPDVLDGLERLELVALDDVDHVAASAEWNLALFRLFNGLLAEGGALLLAADGPPAAIDFVLEDLASRAAAAAVYQLKPLDDADRLRALQMHAAARGLELSDAAGQYLLARVSRDMAALCGWLETLDTASLAAQRKLTIPLIRETLAEHAGA
ncbi:MAG: DnaA regulatory inactivator Hda [Gammaproteobacteria bacterium]|nr:DnaA regulatory inactivator Hda [Gammaproteobacteria bacterium]